MKSKCILLGVLVMVTLLGSVACGSNSDPGSSRRSIVVTYSVLGSVVKQLVGDQADVTVSMPNGADPHEWEPSAKDIEKINKADLVVENGLGLEGGMKKALNNARDSGVKFFTASDHIVVRKVGQGEGIPTGDPDQVVGASDPHLWTDPLTMKDVVSALAAELQQDLSLDVSAQAAGIENRLDALNAEISAEVATIPQADRKLVTGHESMGYFAQRYGFKLVGVVVPSLSSQADVSASGLADLKKAIQDNQPKAIFTELGTSAAIAKTIGSETGVKVIELTTHSIPPDGSYFTFVRNLAGVITQGLK